MVAWVSRHRSVRAGERELVDYIVARAHAYRRETVINYYVTLKGQRFVILAGPHDVDKMLLAQQVAEALVGEATFQWSCFQAHPWWSTQTGHPGQFAMLHARFNALKLRDLVDRALEGAGEGRAFFIGVRRMSQAEVECYFHDLPRGLLWRADASTVRVRLPDNLFVIGTLDIEEESGPLWGQDGFAPYASVVHVERDAPTGAEGGRDAPWPRADRQRAFLKLGVRDSAQAKAKLARILPDGFAPLAPLGELERHLGALGLPPFALEKAWLYLANAFDEEGRGLFVESVAENLAIAQDYVLVQNVLAHIAAQRDGASEAWEEMRGYLAPRFPRAYAKTGPGRDGPGPDPSNGG